MRRHKNCANFKVTMSIFLTIVLVVFGALVLLIAASYNKLTRLKDKADEAWAELDAKLQKRHRLVLSLADIAGAYLRREEGFSQKITAARAQSLQAETMSQKARAENSLSAALKEIFTAGQNQPQLTSDRNFLSLKRELLDLEKEIQATARSFNARVHDFNESRRGPLLSLIAQIFNFKPREFFEA